MADPEVWVVLVHQGRQVGEAQAAVTLDQLATQKGHREAWQALLGAFVEARDQAARVVPVPAPQGKAEAGLKRGAGSSSRNRAGKKAAA